MKLHYLSIIRPKNLVLVLICQLLVYYGLIYPLAADPGELDLGIIKMLLLMLTTILITAAGYVVNDIHDIETDRINKKPKQKIGVHIPIKAGWYYYFGLMLVGGFISIYIAYSIDKLILFLIYPAANLLLYLYSRYFKQMILVGNIVVSLFLAGVPLILWIAESELIYGLSGIAFYRFFIKMGSFIIFAFLLNLKRELIKDIEDIEGDRKVGLSTFPIKFGIPRAKCLLLVYTMVTILLVLAILLTGTYNLIISLLVFLFIPLPLILSCIKVYNSAKKSDWHIISSYYKIIMAIGMILFIL